jgi:hypothetical protein
MGFIVGAVGVVALVVIGSLAISGSAAAIFRRVQNRRATPDDSRYQRFMQFLAAVRAARR